MKNNWPDVLKEEFKKPYFQLLKDKIQADRDAGKIVLPFPESYTYTAFMLTPIESVKVVILGQDPYPNLRDATGLAFSVPSSSEAPKSLKNLFKELKSDTGIENRSNDLTGWASQGVFLLNTVLTTIEKKPGSHRGYGWETFTDYVISCICKNNVYVIYWLLGNEAQKKEQLIINNSKPGSFDLIKLPHPSPLSAHKGFFWSKPYSTTNKLLVKHNLKPIDWSL